VRESSAACRTTLTRPIILHTQAHTDYAKATNAHATISG